MIVSLDATQFEFTSRLEAGHILAGATRYVKTGILVTVISVFRLWSSISLPYVENLI